MAIDDDVYGGGGSDNSNAPLDLGSFTGGGGGSSGGSLFGSNAQAGLGATFGLAGLALDYFSNQQKSEAEARYTQSNIEIAKLEDQVNQQRRFAMQVNARRQQTQQIRDAQQKQSMALAAGVGQTGNAQGSGVQGAQFQASAEGAYNLTGINQNLQIGNSIFDLDTKITAQRIAGFQAQSDANAAGATAGLGKDLMSIAPTLAKFAMGFAAV